MSLEQILNTWAAERPSHEALLAHAKTVLENECRREGLWGRVSGRVKDDVQVARKLRERGATLDNYRRLTDLTGLRVVCRSRYDAERMCDAVRDAFNVVEEENAAERLKLKEFGYKSIHFDAKLDSAKRSATENAALLDIAFEIQIRTLADDVWAEVAHDILYKPPADLPSPCARKVYSLAGFLQVGDDHIQSIHECLAGSLRTTPESTARILEPYYFRLFRRDYNATLTSATLSILAPLLAQETEKVRRDLDAFWNQHKDKIQEMLANHEEELRLLPHASQPEVLALLWLLENRPHDLIGTWQERFPLDDLERLALWWGTSIDELLTPE